MRVRIALQMLVIAFAIGVTFTVYWNWRPAPGAASSASSETASSPALPDAADGTSDVADGREVASLTENIYIVESRNGSDVFAIWAEEQVARFFESVERARAD